MNSVKIWTWFWKKKTTVYPNDDGQIFQIVRWLLSEYHGAFSIVVDTSLGVIRLEQFNFDSGTASAIAIPFHLVSDFCEAFSKAMLCLAGDEDKRSKKTNYITW